MAIFKSTSRIAGRSGSFTGYPAAVDVTVSWQVAQPHAGCRVLGEGGAEWIVQAVHYDEAGPEHVRLIARADLEDQCMASAFTLSMHAWCTFCAGKTLRPAP